METNNSQCPKCGATRTREVFIPAFGPWLCPNGCDRTIATDNLIQHHDNLFDDRRLFTQPNSLTHRKQQAESQQPEQKEERVKCKCPCHTDKNHKHIEPCCDNGWIHIPSFKQQQPEAQQQDSDTEDLRQAAYDRGCGEIQKTTLQQNSNPSGKENEVIKKVADAKTSTIEAHLTRIAELEKENERLKKELQDRIDYYENKWENLYTSSGARISELEAQLKERTEALRELYNHAPDAEWVNGDFALAIIRAKKALESSPMSIPNKK